MSMQLSAQTSKPEAGRCRPRHGCQTAKTQSTGDLRGASKEQRRRKIGRGAGQELNRQMLGPHIARRHDRPARPRARQKLLLRAADMS